MAALNVCEQEPGEFTAWAKIKVRAGRKRGSRSSLEEPQAHRLWRRRVECAGARECRAARQRRRAACQVTGDDRGRGGQGLRTPNALPTGTPTGN